MARVGLLNINEARPVIAPVALDHLGTSLEDAGHEVNILDLTPLDSVDQRTKAIRHFLTDAGLDLLGVTMRNTGTLYLPDLWRPNGGSFLQQHTRHLDSALTHFDPNRVVLGGVGFSTNPQALLEQFGVRYGVTGPGEQVMVDLANRIDQTGRLSENETEIWDGRGLGIPSRRVRRTFVDNAWYYEHGGLGGIRTNNGCGKQCTFCVEPFAKGNRWSVNRMGYVLDELEELLDLGIQDVHTLDSEFNLPLASAQAFLEGVIERGFPNRGLKLWTYCQPKPFNAKFTELMAKAGVKGVNVGIDHLDSEVLANMRKGSCSFEDIQKLVEQCNSVGIAVGLETLFGYSGDNPDKMWTAINRLRKLEVRSLAINLGIAVEHNTPFAASLEPNSPGLITSDTGTPFIDPTFFVDPSFGDPREVIHSFEALLSDQANIMYPSLGNSPHSPELVGSERVQNLLSEGKTGAYWYHFPDRNQN